jgi:hypothetical protein
MKLWGLILFMLLSSQLFAQNYNGYVFDKTTRSPIPNAIIKNGRNVKLSYYDGYFSIANVHFGDTIKVTCIGYKPYNLFVGMTHRDTVRVFMEPSSIMLNNVSIIAQRNHILDSLNLRREFAKTFAYKAPTFADAFLTIDPYDNHPSNFITSDHSTATLVGIDLGAIASMFGKSKTPDSKLHELVLKDEEIRYVDRRFSKLRISSITNLKGDPLQSFMQTYRPPIDEIKKMTDYELMVYIKKCYGEFSKEAAQRN